MFEIPLALFTCHMVISWFIVIDVEGLCGLNISMQIGSIGRSSVFTYHSQVTCNEKSIKFKCTERHRTTGDHHRAVRMSMNVCTCFHCTCVLFFLCVFLMICRVEVCVVQLE